MSQDVSLEVILQVTVPHIVLPTGNTFASIERGRSGSREQEVERTPDEDQEQVRVLRLPLQSSISSPEHNEQQFLTGEAVTYTTQRGGLFRLFRFKNLPTQGQKLLLQVLRRWKRGNQQSSTATKDREQLWITDELAFSIEFRKIDDTTEKLPAGRVSALYTGLNQVVIFLDKDGIPTSYSINGAES